MNDETPDERFSALKVEPPIDRRHAEVLAAMDQIQNRRPSWTRAVILFVVSLTLFAGAGAFSESLRFLVVLIGVLVVHELGHFLAMKWFGYRNLRIFFIPFFGAAVSGQHFDVAGWKKVIVSLLGPLPGIAIGILLGGFAIYLKQNPAAANVSHELLLEIATVSLVINGFNLLPILPLDGGWVMHAVIFCRHPIFDASFRLVASLAMLLLGAMLNALFFLFIGGFLLLGIPMTYRMSKLARKLRTEGVEREASSGGSIPTNTATKIIDGVELATRHSASPQIVATHSLQVFETLNATPPGIFASGFFVALHALSLTVAIMVASVLFIEKQSSFEEFAELAISSPRYAHVCGSTESWSSPDWKPEQADEKLLLIAHRDTMQVAAAEFAKLSSQPAADGKLTLFGQSLVVDVKDKAAHNAWKKQLQTAGEVLPPGLVSVRVQCMLPSVERARNVKQDCEDYDNWLDSPDWLIPPWSHPDNLTDAGLDRVRLARRTFQKVREKELELGAKAGVGETYAKEIAPAALANDQNRIDELVEQVHKEQLANFQNTIAALRSSVSSPIETQVLDVMLKHELFATLDSEQPEPPAEFAELLGRFALNADGKVPFEDAASKCFHVEAKQAAFLVAIKVDSFESTAVGLTRLSKWLGNRGTNLIHYDITTKPDPLAIGD
jgi:Zn-dependent protease